VVVPLGAVPPTAPRRGRLWAVLLLVLVLAVMVWVVGLAMAGGGTAPVAAIGLGPAGSGGQSAPVDAPPGILSAGGVPMLPVAGVAGPHGELAGLAGRPVRATAVLVESVPADEGFWVGTSGDDRVWVQLDGAGESPYRVRAGEHVDLSGQVVAHGPEYAAAIGLSADEGAEQLTRQAAHLEVPQGGVRLVR
jgi:hypothetical protein